MITAVAVAALTALYIAIGVAGMARLDRERETLKRAGSPLVSVIIPAYRSQRTIEETLRSARALDYPRKEIIVVNDSRDSTPSIARGYGARVIQNPKRMGKPASLNMATRAARGELLLFLDSDTTASRDCLKRMVPWFSRKDVAAVMPRYLLKNDSPVSRLASLENIFTFALLRVHMFFGSLVGFRGCSVLVRRDLLLRHPWPDTILEDNHLSATLAGRGHRIIWEPCAVTWTREPGSMRDLRRQKRRWGEGAYLAFRKHWRFYLKSPQFITFFYPYFALGITAGILILLLMASPMAFPSLTLPVLLEIACLFTAMYLHSLIFFYLGSRRLLPLRTLGLMLFYFPVMTYSYFRGILTGIRRKRRGMNELHFRQW
jgi:cellulose synthase/poly-beta-1,6-N-acetylglucosamine synthase-like glycosyltransferase